MAVTTERVKHILGSVEVTGSRVTIPDRLNREDYAAVNSVFTALGGTWSRTDQAHVFPEDPSVRIAAVLAGEALPKPARTAEGFVPTPPELADVLVREYTRLTELDAPQVLEPSAGDGALVDAIRVVAPDATIVAVEPNVARAADLGTWPGVSLVTSTLEEYAATLHHTADHLPAEAVGDQVLGGESADGRFDAVMICVRVVSNRIS